MFRFVCVALSWAALPALIHASPDDSRTSAIVNGRYRLWKADRLGYAIVDAKTTASEAPDEMDYVVEPQISSIDYQNGIIYGYRKKVRYVDGFETTPGYFVLNTGTGATTTGLTEFDMGMELRKYLLGPIHLQDPANVGKE